MAELNQPIAEMRDDEFGARVLECIGDRPPRPAEARKILRPALVGDPSRFDRAGALP